MQQKISDSFNVLISPYGSTNSLTNQQILIILIIKENC